MTEATLVLKQHLKELGVFTLAEVRVCQHRKFLFDLAEKRSIENKKRPVLAFEIDGGIWTGGRHVTGAGRQRDMEKDAEANIAGYLVWHFTPQMVMTGKAKDYIRRWLDSCAG